MRLLLATVVLAACGTGAPAPAPGPQAARSAPPSLATPPPAPSPRGPGKVTHVTFHSDALGVDKQYVIYLPGGYDSSTTRYPVFYYLHGLGGNEDNWVDGAKLDQAADRIGLNAIVVMPDGDDGFYVNGVAPVDYDACIKSGKGLFMPLVQNNKATCVRKRDYETYIVNDLVAHVDATYRSIPTRKGRAIAGLSMGGFGALQLAMRHRDVFAAAASHSGVDSLMFNGPIPYRKDRIDLLTDPRTWGGGGFLDLRRWILELFGDDLAHWREIDPTTLVASLPPGELALYLDCGTEDEFMLNNHAEYLHDLLTARGIQHVFFLGPGHHNFAFWSERVSESLLFLQQHTTTAVAR